MKEVIRETAVYHFNAYGYEGVKMSKIAEEVGIRKQSLSYHYPSKKKLLLETYHETIKEEILFIEEFFSNKDQLNTKEILWLFLKETERRFHKQPSVAFLQIMSFRAPLELEDLINSYYLEYLHTFKQHLILLAADIDTVCSPEEFAISFITIFHGLIAQIIYESSKSFHYASQATFSVFWKGITSK